MMSKDKLVVLKAFQEASLEISPSYIWKESWTVNKAQEQHFNNFLKDVFHVNNYNSITVNSPIDWTIDPFENRSWLFHYHKLSFLDGFVSMAHSSKQIVVQQLDKCISAIKSNYAFITNKTHATKYEFCWHDHTTANRLTSVTQLLCYAKESISEENTTLLLNYVNLHVAFLKQDWFYSKHTNHGLDQAKALYTGASLLGDQEGIDTSLARIKDEIEFAFTSDGVHVENSPCYHQYVLGIFFKLKTLLKPHEWAQIDKLHIFLDAFNFLVHSSRPDRMLPTIGDSELFQVRDYYRGDPSIENKIEYKNLQYVVTDGTSGIAPSELFYVSDIAGYAFSRDSWTQQALFLSFKSGCRSDYHRQADDLSITITNKGEDWILDGGMFNHNRTDPVRKYMRSIDSHSTVSVLETSKSMTKEVCQQTSRTLNTLKDNINGVSHILSGISKMNDGVECARRINHHLQRQEITIQDSIATDSNLNLTARIRFLVPEDKTITRVQNGFRLSSPSGNVMTILSEFPVKSYQIRSKAYYSQKLNKLNEGKFIDFEIDFIGSITSLVKIYFQ